MRKFTSLASILLAGFILVGCSNSSKNEFEGIPAQELYNKGQTYLEKGDYNNAIRYLEEVDLRGEKGSYAEQIQLSIIYSQYKLGEYYKALDVAERFVRAHPDSHSMDYVYYLAGLSNARLGDNWIQNLFRIDDSGRAVDSVRNAFGNFQTVVQKYPHSQYAEDAKKWLPYLRNRLANYELGIAKFYMKRNAYVAVANRVEDMMNAYPESNALQEALPLLQRSFEAMNINDSAQKVAMLIKANKIKNLPKIVKPKYSESF